MEACYYINGYMSDTTQFRTASPSHCRGKQGMNERRERSTAAAVRIPRCARLGWPGGNGIMDISTQEWASD